VNIKKIGYPLAEMSTWPDQRVEAGVRRHGGECVRHDLQSLCLKAEITRDDKIGKKSLTRASMERRRKTRMMMMRVRDYLRTGLS